MYNGLGETPVQILKENVKNTTLAKNEVNVVLNTMTIKIIIFKDRLLAPKCTFKYLSTINRVVCSIKM